VASDPLMLQAVRKHRDALLAREAVQMREMAAVWARAERELESAFDALALQIQALRDAGEVVTPGKVFRLERYSRLLFEVRRETAQYADYAAKTVQAGQESAAWLAQEEARSTLSLGLPRRAIAPGLVQLNPRAVEAMVGIMGNGTPLRQYLEGVYGDAARGMSKYLTRAVTQGLNPLQTARAMKKGLGLGLDRALTIARTEQLRVYRESSRLTYQASGVVEAQRRVAAHDDRTCLGCLLADGEIIPLGEPLADHVRGRCTTVPILIGAELPQWETGATWLEKQPEATQRKIMGPTRHDLWKSGEVPLKRMVTHTHDPLWGGSLGPTPVKDLIGRAAEAVA
jgi:hypothetical protein